MKLNQSSNQRQRFVISPEIFKSVSPEEVDATYFDMVELNIAKPPFQHMDVELDASNVFSKSILIPKGTKYDDFDEMLTAASSRAERIAKVGQFSVLIRMNFADDFKSVAYNISVDKGDGNFQRFKQTGPNLAEVYSPNGLIEIEIDSLNTFYGGITKLIIVLLATRNIVKEVKINKLAKLGIGKHKHRPHTVTYLKIGKITESVSRSGDVGSATGRHLMPHLRRGHKRDQRYGLGLKYTKSIYIWPMFVNADKEWIADRSEYRVL
jgi:hypothetical protein